MTEDNHLVPEIFLLLSVFEIKLTFSQLYFKTGNE